MTNKNKVLERIEELRVARGWTLYKLADMACITQSTLTNAKTRNTTPSISTIIAICDAFEITLSQFFTTDEEQTIILTGDEQKVIKDYQTLETIDKVIIKDVIRGLKEKNKMENTR